MRRKMPPFFLQIDTQPHLSVMELARDKDRELFTQRTMLEATNTTTAT
jgi:hypothetical protein